MWSVAKEFTAATGLRLFDDHRLALDDAVASHLPGFPYPDITVSQLLAHSSGIPEVLDHYGAQLQAGHLSAPITTRDAVSVLAGERKPLLFAPGTRFDYSNTGYIVIDRKSVVEGKSGSVRVDHGGRRIVKKKKNKSIHE